MFASFKQDRVKQRLYLSNGAVRAWRLKTRAEWLRVTSGGADQIPRGTQSQGSPHRLSGFLSGVLAALREWRQRKNGRLELARLDERMLRDIGLTRFDAEYEITSHFGENDGHEPGFSEKEDACR